MMSMTSTAVEVAGSAEHRLRPVVVLVFVDHEIHIDIVPTRKRARRLTDVAFGVVTHSHREQFHDLAGKIFIGCAPDIHPGIQEGQHRRVLSDRHHQIAKVAGTHFVEHFDFAKQFAIVPDLAFVDRVVSVPEQRHLFLKRTVAGDHAVSPPIGHSIGFEQAGAEPVEELVDDRLQPPIPCWLHLDSKGLSGFLGQIRRGGTAGREGFDTWIVDAGMVEPGEVAVVDVLEIDHGAHDLARRRRGQLRYLFGGFRRNPHVPADAVPCRNSNRRVRSAPGRFANRRVLSGRPRWVWAP